jgi:hypothetical protein
MFQAIKNYIHSSGNKPISNDEVRSGAEATFTSISNHLIPTLKLVSKSSEYFKGEQVYVLEDLGGSLGLRSDKPEDVIKSLLEFFKDVSSSEAALMKLIDKDVRDKVFPTMARAQELAILKTVSDLSSITLFTLDLLYYVTLGEDTSFPAKRVTDLKEGLSSYRSMLKAYIGRFDKHVDELAKVSRNDIKADAPASLMDKLLAKHGKLVTLPLVNGFINNPIYHIRLWRADKEFDKYEALKDKKKLIELKLLDIKMRAAGKHDERMAKQIEYYEDKISGMEQDIREYEGN